MFYKLYNILNIKVICLPISTAPYTRAYAHTKGRGKEGLVRCEFCGRSLPRWKAFTKFKRPFGLDPSLRREIKSYNVHMISRKIYVCPSCARFRRIIQPGKTVRKKHLNI
jgi:small subunit ribosomal protein S26e